MGFDRATIEAVGGEWKEFEPINDALARLSSSRLAQIRPEGDAAKSKVVWKIECFQQAILYRVVMLAEGSAASWNIGNVLAAVLCARALMEASALVLDFEAQLTQFCAKDDFASIDALVMNRIFSTKLEDWREKAEGVTAINVLTLIDKLDKLTGGARSHYDFLSEMCHPNSLGHYQMFASLDKKSAIVSFSAKLPVSRRFLDHIGAACFLILLVEKQLGRISELRPRVLDLSEAARKR